MDGGDMSLQSDRSMSRCIFVRAVFAAIIRLAEGYLVTRPKISVYCKLRVSELNLLRRTGYVMHHQFNIQQL